MNSIFVENWLKCRLIYQSEDTFMIHFYMSPGDANVKSTNCLYRLMILWQLALIPSRLHQFYWKDRTITLVVTTSGPWLYNCAGNILKCNLQICVCRTPNKYSSTSSLEVDSPEMGLNSEQILSLIILHSCNIKDGLVNYSRLPHFPSLLCFFLVILIESNIAWMNQMASQWHHMYSR
jgi:hypothetical protein